MKATAFLPARTRGSALVVMLNDKSVPFARRATGGETPRVIQTLDRPRVEDKPATSQILVPFGF